MNSVSMPALSGSSPLGILAAIGVLRLLSDFTVEEPRLSWSPSQLTAVLHSSHPNLESIAASLLSIVERIDDGALLPGVGAGFPPPGAAPDGLRADQARLRATREALLHGKTTAESTEAERWMASLVTDLATDDKGRVAISQYTAPTGKQSMATMLEKPLALVRKEPDYLRQALMLWRRVPGVTGENLDHRALWDATEDAAGKPSMRGVPGATWLALMSYPLFRTTAVSGRPISSGWHSTRQRGRRMQELRLPVWTAPITTAGVTALIEHPALAQCTNLETGEFGLTPALRTLGVVHVCRARRYQPPGGQSAGVLTPVAG